MRGAGSRRSATRVGRMAGGTPSLQGRPSALPQARLVDVLERRAQSLGDGLDVPSEATRGGATATTSAVTRTSTPRSRNLSGRTTAQPAWVYDNS